MTQLTSKLMRGAIAATLAGAITAGAVSTASAQDYRAPTGGGLGSVVSCDAPGGKQAGGALIGAPLAAAAGSNLAKNDRGDHVRTQRGFERLAERHFASIEGRIVGDTLSCPAASWLMVCRDPHANSAPA